MSKNKDISPAGYTKVSTYTQAEYHFRNNQILAVPISWFTSACIQKLEDDLYEVAFIPLLGRARCYLGDTNAFKRLIDEYDFYVFEGGRLETKDKVTVFDKAVDWITGFFGRGN